MDHTTMTAEQLALAAIERVLDETNFTASQRARVLLFVALQLGVDLGDEPLLSLVRRALEPHT